jgi:hypothetical protein
MLTHVLIATNDDPDDNEMITIEHLRPLPRLAQEYQEHLAARRAEGFYIDAELLDLFLSWGRRVGVLTTSPLQPLRLDAEAPVIDGVALYGPPS